MKVSIHFPSWNRPDNVETWDYIPSATAWVDFFQYDEYVRNYPDKNIVQCPQGVQGNLCRVRNYILDQEQDKNDAILLIDDDMSGIYYWEKKEAVKLRTEEIIPFLQKYSLIAKEIGAKLWGININRDKQVYREYTPFSMKSYIGGPFQCFLKGNELRYDERLPLKEDYDMTIQQCNRYRKVFRVNKYFYAVKQAEQEGGCATYRSIARERKQFELLQKKWGKHIIKADRGKSRSHNTKKQRGYDINPIIRIPIAGV